MPAIPIAGIAMIVAVVFIVFYFLTKRKVEEERRKERKQCLTKSSKSWLKKATRLRRT